MTPDEMQGEARRLLCLPGQDNFKMGEQWRMHAELAERQDKIIELLEGMKR